MKLFQSNLRVLAARIIDIRRHDTDPLYLLLTDSESVQVGPDWISKNMPEVGGYVVIDHLGLTSYKKPLEIEGQFTHIGDVDLAANADKAGPAPEPAAAVEPAPANKPKQKPIRARRKGRK